MDAAQVSTDGIADVAAGSIEGARRSVAPLSALLLAALLLRAIPWLANLPLHHDEALYGTWARAIADGSDPLLLIPWVDKPPLVLYLLGLSIRLLGASEMALRVPGMVAGLLTVWATYGLGRRVVGERGAWAGALLMALSPFALLFAPTAFTDGWLTLFLIAAAWAALARRPGWAGVLLGLACASKQQGVMGVPLILALIVVGCLEREDTKAFEGRLPAKLAQAKLAQARNLRRVLGAVGLAALGFAIVFGVVTYWDSLRWHNRPSYWDQSLQTYGGVVLAPLGEWPRRAGAWVAQAGNWFGAAPVTALILALPAAGYLSVFLRSRRVVEPSRRAGARHLHPGTSDIVPRLNAGPVIAAYILGYLIVHVALTFQPWDRYLLPILPLACILCGQGLVAGRDSLRAWDRLRLGRWMGAGLAAVLLHAASLGLTASIPVGSDIGAYRGVAEAAGFLRTQPPGTTVYYDRIGWHLGYYLYGRPIARSWYDSPSKLASEAARVANENAGAVQWLALPAWEETRLTALQEALATKGFVASPAYEALGKDGAAHLTLYRLEPKPLAAGRQVGGYPQRADAGP